MTDTTIQLNPKILSLRCSLSGTSIDPAIFNRPFGLCSCCPPPGRPLVVEYDLDPDSVALRPEAPGLAAFSDLLPVTGVLDSFWGDVGRTPTINNPHLSSRFGVDVMLKNEASNPSGSFKDRGLAVAVALGQACGAASFCLPTQGNAGVAASLFSARIGARCLVYMPEGYQEGVYHRAARHFAAEIRFTGANIAETGRRMRTDLADDLESGRRVDVSTFFEPGRLEGKKTMGLEIAMDAVGDRLPDWILYPTGGGTGLVGIWKGLAEMRALGLLPGGSLPRMVAVQSEGCAPVVRAFEQGLEQVEPVVSAGTVADGLDVPGAIMGHEMLRVLRSSKGTAVAVSEQAIVEEMAGCGRSGINTSFEGAALVAALDLLRQSGEMTQGQRVLLLLTASQLIALDGLTEPVRSTG